MDRCPFGGCPRDTQFCFLPAGEAGSQAVRAWVADFAGADPFLQAARVVGDRVQDLPGDVTLRLGCVYALVGVPPVGCGGEVAQWLAHLLHFTFTVGMPSV